MYKKFLYSLLLISIDITTIIITFQLAFYIYNNSSILNKFYIYDFSFFVPLILLFYYEGIYTHRFDFWQEIKKIFKSLLISYFLAISFFLFFNKTSTFNLPFITLFFLLMFVIFPIVKRYTKRVIFAKDFFKQKVKLIGDKEQINILKREFQENWYLGLKENHNKYEVIIIASKNIEISKLQHIIEGNIANTQNIYVMPYITDINFANSNILEYSNIRYNVIQIENRLLNKKNIYIKQISDIVISLLILPILFLLNIFISIAIKMDSKGPVFYKQLRAGKNRTIFYCYKYRTMYVDSDTILKNYLTKHPEEIEYYNKYHKYKNDPRVTKIGRFLRKSSLDELPQIINVLKNEMSIVGPRPYMPNEIKNLKEHTQILLVKPGLTGLWQVSGRNNLTFKQRVELEKWYIKNWSLWLDFIIYIKTIKTVLYRVGSN